MDILKTYSIPFVGLSFGKHEFEYDLDDSFFKAFSYTEILPVLLHCDVILDKKNTFMELHIRIKGSITLICDTTIESFSHSIDQSMDLIVKFGETYDTDDDVVWIIPHESYQINIAQVIYEAVLLAIPVKKIHPGIADGTLKSEVLEKLRALETKEQDNIDPRWDKLNELLTQKKQQNGTS